MKIFNCILGVLAIFGSIYCILFPEVAFLHSGWIVTALLGAWGICAIFNYVTNRDDNSAQQQVIRGGLGIGCAVAAAAFSILALFFPSIDGVLDALILALLSAWLIVSGVDSMLCSMVIKNQNSNAWIFTFVMGIIVAIIGIYGFFHMVFLAETVGLLTGILLMIYGVRLLLSAFERR